MKTKKVLFGKEAREAIFYGIDLVAKAIRPTIGPKGRNAVLQNTGLYPVITNDGVSIAKSINLKSQEQNVGVLLMQEMADKTNKIAGDGTTTTQVLAHTIIQKANDFLDNECDAMSVKRGIHNAANDIVKVLQEQVTKVDNLDTMQNVANISVESKEIGNILAEVLQKTGVDGTVTVEASPVTGVSYESVDGFKVDSGFISPYMVNDMDRMNNTFSNPFIFITANAITDPSLLLNILNNVVKTDKKELVIFAQDVAKEALSMLILNKLKGVLNVCVVKTSNLNPETIQDLAKVCDTEIYSTHTGHDFNTITLDMLGTAKKIVINQDSTIVIEGAGDISSTVAVIKEQMNIENNDFLKQRLATILGKVTVIHVGASTETEQKYLQLKIEDAVNATRAAMIDGVVAGGGSALIHAVKGIKPKGENESELLGYRIMIDSCSGPLKQIAKNCGLDEEETLLKVQDTNNGGLNAKTNQVVENMFEQGIIDPFKVTKHAVLNAASMASTFITTEILTVDDE